VEPIKPPEPSDTGGGGPPRPLGGGVLVLAIGCLRVDFDDFARTASGKGRFGKPEGFGVWGLGLGVWGLGFGVWGMGLGLGLGLLLVKT